MNLRAMLTLREAFGIATGYSDHTRGIEIPIAATALGATVIEKHFTLDTSMPGPDHAASLNPDELEEMVRRISHVSMALGSAVKRVTPSERKNMEAARKSIVAATDIKEGEFFTEDNLTVKRPGTGISPMRWDEIIGKASTRFYKADDLIQ